MYLEHLRTQISTMIMNLYDDNDINIRMYIVYRIYEVVSHMTYHPHMTPEVWLEASCRGISHSLANPNPSE